ncbi:MAG: HAD family hydrolase, partial [Puniceicoccaceae bacterium]
VQAMNSDNYKAVLFDLDGTLIDHFRVIYRCYQYALEHLGLPPVSYATVKASVGGPIVIAQGKHIQQDGVDEAVVHSREEFAGIGHDDIEILPGAEWLLKELQARGLKLCFFTNREGARARRILNYIGMASHLDGIYGTLDTPWKKPEPEFTHHVLKEMGTDPAHACMIGDSPYDVDAAAVADMPCYTVATGSHTIQQLQTETQSAGVYANLYELGQAVFNLTPPESPAT